MGIEASHQKRTCSFQNVSNILLTACPTELPVAIAKQLGNAYAIEPNCDRNRLLVSNISRVSVEIRQGTAEQLPFENNMFGGAVALWILHYVDDLEQSLVEMTRVVNPRALNARIVIVTERRIMKLLTSLTKPAHR